MPKCPKCKADIAALYGDFMEWNRHICTIHEETMSCDFKEVNGTADESGDNQYYYCPECDEEIFQRYVDAESFLSGD